MKKAYFNKNKIATDYIVKKISSHCCPAYSEWFYLSRCGLEDLAYDLRVPISVLQEIIFPMFKNGCSGDNMLYREDLEKIAKELFGESK